MSTIAELRAEAQTKGNELIKEFQALDAQKNEILLKQKQIEKQVDAINGEINAYNKIEPPVTDPETTQEPETELEPAK